ncbi:MAG: bifunctional phosphopantothenoylcysteine decarboxylase/phosphopantothenate--cysteine ligase CoaBC [Hyphomonadaceae bacterium]|nr:MAG: phosphopantothenoylcysteine decarboxylase / phosphopantothenate--cysteine ligase [Caulobacteraceae bacterium]MBT9444385.1 bifunctional phosphopantothenoylcysteine decarboxylase/phosphopantothenate--cysteine ligase CoaBC [Hyphomonadaceae bacterium]TPW08724.1 MAG: phosphopantothenoylcysteine decarboxylase / phosphopantothenate--cysteine ligase [Alphaproteobacteria bacterium]
MTERRVLLVIGGGIAAYKSLELIRLLAKSGVRTRAIVTNAASHFVTPLSVGSLTEDKVYGDLFSLTDEAEMGHIQLSRSADLVVVAPATADLMAKVAHGLANDLASTALLATDKPVLMAPAMNVRMWLNAATQRNRARLAADGVQFIGPDDGAMACGEFGPGRMAEPQAIHDAILAFYDQRAIGQPLAGRKVLVTAGPTLEQIDPVRFISNRSSGKQGFAIAEALARLGAHVRLVSGPVALADPFGVDIVRVESAEQMLAACEAALPADAAVCVAAVADWRPESTASKKIKKGADGPPPISLSENPDILATLSKKKSKRPRLVVGFAAETNDVEAHAKQKLAKKGCDWIVANDVSGDVMGGDSNQVMIIRADGVERWPEMAKTAVAGKLAAEIAAALA